MAASPGQASDASSLALKEGREEYFETGVEEGPQRSKCKQCPLVDGPQKEH